LAPESAAVSTSIGRIRRKSDWRCTSTPPMIACMVPTEETSIAVATPSTTTVRMMNGSALGSVLASTTY
jgi:hypothetical protein